MRAEISDHAVAKEVSVMRRGVGDNPAFLTPAMKSLAIYTKGSTSNRSRILFTHHCQISEASEICRGRRVQMS